MTEKLFHYLDNYAEAMKDNVPGFISVSVVELATGKTHISKSKVGVVDEEMNRLQAETVKYALKGAQHIHDLKIKKFEDIVITLDEEIHLMITSDVQSFMSYIVMDAQSANLALAQNFHKQFYTQSIQAIVSEFGQEQVSLHPFFQPQDFTIEEKQPQKIEMPEEKRGGFLFNLFNS